MPKTIFKLLVGSILCAVLPSGLLHAQTAIVDASYSNSGAPIPASSPVAGVTLDNFTVGYIYHSTTSSLYTYAFLEDTSAEANNGMGAYAYLYLPSGSAFTPVLGGNYSNFIIDQNVFASNGAEEFTLDSGNTTTTETPVSTTPAGSIPVLMVTPSMITTTSPISVDFGAAGNNLLFAPLEFNTGVLTTGLTEAIGGSGNLTTADGSIISLYHPDVAFTLQAGYSYTIEGAMSPYQGNAEILNPEVIATQVPEPSSRYLMLAGFACLLCWGGRRWLTA